MTIAGRITPRTYIALGVAAIALYFVMPLGWATSSIYGSLGLISAIVILVAARRKKAGRGAWTMIGIGALSWACGDIVFFSYELVFQSVAPYPSMADFGYLFGYLCFIVGVLMYLESHCRTLLRYTLMDAALVSLPIGLIAWELVVSKYVEAVTADTFTALVSLGYPLMDLALLGAAGALMLAPRSDRVTRLLGSGFCLVFVADMFYNLDALNGTDHTRIWYDALWLLATVLYAAAALHPDRDAVLDTRRVGEHHGTKPKYILALILALFGARAAQYFWLGGFHVHAAVIVGAAIALLALIRMTAETRIALASETNYHALLEHASDAIFVSIDGHFLEVNEKACVLTGYERSDLVGLPTETLSAPHRGGMPREAVQASGDAVEDDLLRKDGAVVAVERSVRTLADGRQLAIVRDVTERKRLEDSLNQSRKMGAVGQLAGGIAHDFNNLLSVISNYTRFAYEDSHRSDAHKADLGEVLNASDRAAELVKQLLAFSSTGESRAEVFDIDEVIRGMSGLLRRTVRESIDIRVDLTDTPNRVEMDRGKLEQILLNLVVNARDALSGGGVMKITTMHSTVDAREAQLMRVHPGEFEVLMVTDDGCGMTEQVRERIFEPYFTTKPTGDGTGLGLATVYGIVEQLGGTVIADSTFGRGAILRVYIPSSTKPLSPVVVETTEPEVAERGTVLVVDDELAIQRIIERVLTADGYRVLTPETPEAALALMEESDVTVDLVITDVVMPRISGCELVQRIKQTRPDVPAMYVSGYAKAIMGEHGLAEDEVHLAKPFMPEDLRRAVATVLGEQRPGVPSPQAA